MATNLSIEAGLAASNAAYQIAWQGLFSNPQPGAFTFYSKEVPSDTEVTNLVFLSKFPQMREWIGARRENYLRSYSQSVTMKTYEVTLPFPRKSLQYRDKLGLITSSMQEWLAGVHANCYDQFAYTKYMSATGAGPTGYDGAALFSTAHPHSGSAGNQSNLAAATNLNASTLDAALVAVNSYTFENNEPAGFRPTHMLIGPSLERRAKALLGSDVRVVTIDANGKLDAVSGAVAAAAGPNVFKGELTLVVDQRRIGTPAFYWDILSLNKPGITPIIQIVGEAPHPVHQDQMDSDRRFNKDQFIYGVEADFVFDAGHWMSAYRATGTA